MSIEEEHEFENQLGTMDTDWFEQNMLDEINGLCTEVKFLPTKRLETLEQGLKHKITLLKKITTKYGERLVAELEDFQVFLPVRLNKLSANQVKYINRNNLSLVTQGPCGRSTIVKFVK